MILFDQHAIIIQGSRFLKLIYYCTEGKVVLFPLDVVEVAPIHQLQGVVEVILELQGVISDKEVEACHHRQFINHLVQVLVQ